MAPSPLRFSSATDVDTTLDILVRNTSDMEIVEDGPSAAQEPTTHTFAVGEKLLTIIDTPGIVVFDKEEQDRENFESILSHLSQELQEIQCICILLSQIMPGWFSASLSSRWLPIWAKILQTT